MGKPGAIGRLVSALIIDPLNSFYLKPTENWSDPYELLQMQVEFEMVSESGISVMRYSDSSGPAIALEYIDGH